MSQVGNTCVDAPLAEEATFREAGGPYDLPDHVHFSHSPERVKTVTTGEVSVLLFPPDR